MALERGAEGHDQRWLNVLKNLKGAADSVNSLEDILEGKRALFVDAGTFAAAASHAETDRTQRRRIVELERALSASKATSTHWKTQAEIAQSDLHAARERISLLEEELENTSAVFQLHTSELRARQEEVERKTSEIRVLKGIIETISKGPSTKNPNDEPPS